MRLPPSATALALACTLAATAVLAQPAAAVPAVAASTAPVPAPASTACSDFDEYVNGRWRAATELPPERARIGSFDQLARSNERLLAHTLQELAATSARQTSPGLKLLAAYYSSGMDLPAIERRGLQPLQPLLRRIDAVERTQLPAMLGELARVGVSASIALFVGIDAKDATRHVLSLQQAGLGLPDRDDYTKQDPTSERLRTDYRRHAAVLLQAAQPGLDGAALAARVEKLMAFEGQLAAASMDRVLRRDPNVTYNPVTLASLQAQAPGLDWAALLVAYGGPALLDAARNTAAQPPLMVLGQPEFAAAVASLVREAPLATWRDYLQVRLLDAIATHGPRLLADSKFDYEQRVQRGLRAPPPRVEQVILAIGGPFGGAPLSQTLGELFTAQAFSPLAQQRAQQMVEDIRAGMRQRILASPWMSPATQQVALGKLDAMSTKIGAPERWKTYDGLRLAPDDYLGNLLKVNAWNTADRLGDLGKPVDRTRWNTSPHIVNAFAASGNQIVFPAGILQPPFFDANADDASNYGAIGMVIGHEITHHFDDRGRQFDALGNLRDWWQPADVAAYKARADRVAALYDSYEPVPGERINGRQTLGENISDIGGIQIAYAGLQIALERQRRAGQPVPLVDGHTAEQRFFMANAVVWRSKQRTEALVQQIRTGQHSPGRWRVLGPLSQMEAFALAFRCKPGDAMVAAEPIVVW